MTSPLHQFNAKNIDRWSVMLDMPDWINEQCVDLVTRLYFDESGNVRNNTINVIQMKLRLMLKHDLGLSFASVAYFKRYLRDGFSVGDERMLLFLDITIKYVRDYAPERVEYGNKMVNSNDILIYLDSLLENGSKWRVVYQHNSEAGIVERVDHNLTKLAKEVEDEHLIKAWNFAFQLNPRPEQAVEEAQKAIESVASEAKLTKLTSSVYGGLLADIKANPNKYNSAAKEAYQMHDILNKNDNNINEMFSVWISNGLDLVQKTNPSRHKSLLVKDFHLSIDAARQAVIITTLITWLISSRYFTKVVTKNP